MIALTSLACHEDYTRKYLSVPPKMLIVFFVVINNEEEAAVVLSEWYTSESPGSTFAKIYMLSLARCTESESRF